MRRHQAIKDSFLENRIFLSRTVILFVLILVLISGLVARLIYLQVAGHSRYHGMATNNRIKVTSVPPTRGIIYDKQGRILAENLPSYSLEIIPEQVTDMGDTLQRLQLALAIPEEKIEAFKKHRKRYKHFDSIPLLMQLSNTDVAKFAVLRHTFPGVDIHARLIRHYPYAELTAHVVGYVGRINEQELKILPEAEYRSIHSIGKIGVERAYEDILRGHAGYSEIEINAQGKPINELGKIEPTPGADIYLTVDVDLQKVAYDALAEYNGSVVALDLETGGVLVQVSKASFDPNLFVSGISHADYKTLNSSKNKPLFDRVLRGQYPPGSTLKPFIALAGLEHEITHMHETLFCPGYYQLPNNPHKYRDWKKWGHGKVNLDIAITQSCDVYFYDMSLALGIDKLSGFLHKFGFGKKTGIDLKGEKAGLLPSREWKRINREQAWFPGETLITGIGQGFTQVTPMQLARATATLANQGQVVTPYIAERIIDDNREIAVKHPPAKNIELKPSNVQDIIGAMVHVVHSARGTAKSIAKDIDFKIAGKTGTAQVYTIKQDEEYNEEEISFNMRDHALFIAFAPADDPKIAVAVIAEHGSHGGSIAAPIAAAVIKQYLAQ
ncbi:MAG: penicillin-binding protein 2 [Gammaproteobacteria bacterium]|jgi:penicillin-binding protein 2|nr:penicillin-binding protein 2 [Gammaproteobacteria bacterium]MBT5223661.1 penicillin-binding protein 2 [Gammaproteobacteria bacterium]MBT5824577.1 penicillin-binding protein 2 [Gammaproteobacteria bacterium]MBT6420788.1 penicillin-binding protein 2 [Gammaproteobacteria bacterium]MBT6576410.1 penicillin-binding protein 2 [Gammaproteobacteria bacterium]